MPPDLPGEATVLEKPDTDDGSFARLVGVYAAGLEKGRTPAQAFARAIESSGWQAISESSDPADPMADAAIDPAAG